ncbi:hypothetical protein B0H63DRAFT_255129 [Podospora didyma]|uniref:Rhodopsin domain-containing protein n=1 Tax=Podospora didyma TaxID=330526 RepID=A0AAE0KEF6_9PEZI|nr:hypothetical protein B0H63DRAFT_255129 [Podospora didyma]
MSSSPRDTVDPAESLSGTIVACASVSFFFSSVAVALRFYVRGKLLNALAREDWSILAALVFTAVSTGFTIFGSQVALGRHMVANTPADIMAYLHAAYFMSLFYHLSICFTKVSILLLYLRVFVTVHHYIRKAVWVTLAIVVLYSAWTFAMHMTMCIPLSKTWDTSLPGRCQGAKVWWAVTYLHISTDFLIFVLPIPVVISMTIPLRQKAGLLVVFAMGFFVCLISVLRTLWLNALLYSKDMTWDLVSIANWSIVEINMAVLCACLTTLKPLVTKFVKPWIHALPFHRRHEYTLNTNAADQHPSRPKTIGSLPLNNALKARQGQKMDLAPLESIGGSTDEGTLLGSDADITTFKKGEPSERSLVGTPAHAANDTGMSTETGIEAPPKAHTKGPRVEA